MEVTAVCRRSGNWWAVEIPEVEGAFTQARRLDQVADMAADGAAHRLAQLSLFADLRWPELEAVPALAALLGEGRDFADIVPDRMLLGVLMRLKTRNTDALISGVADVLRDHGIDLIDSTAFLAPLLARPGVLTGCAPSEEQRADLELGYRVADTLARLDTDDRPAPSELLGGQEWANEMPCIVILCAQLERTMWKYSDANAYRVVLIEAGHIGQNLMLAATYHGLSACPSAALNHSLIRKCIHSKSKISEAPIYALTLGKPNINDPSISAF